MAKKSEGKQLAQNKKASHDYFIEETYECGHGADRHGDQVRYGREKRTSATALRRFVTVKLSSITCISVLSNKATAAIRRTRHVLASCC